MRIIQYKMHLPQVKTEATGAQRRKPQVAKQILNFAHFVITDPRMVNGDGHADYVDMPRSWLLLKETFSSLFRFSHSLHLSVCYTFLLWTMAASTSDYDILVETTEQTWKYHMTGSFFVSEVPCEDDCSSPSCKVFLFSWILTVVTLYSSLRINRMGLVKCRASRDTSRVLFFTVVGELFVISTMDCCCSPFMYPLKLTVFCIHLFLFFSLTGAFSPVQQSLCPLWWCLAVCFTFS